MLAVLGEGQDPVRLDCSVLSEEDLTFTATGPCCRERSSA